MNVVAGMSLLSFLIAGTPNSYENNKDLNVEILEDKVYEEIALSYLKCQYKGKSISYDNLSVILTNDLLDDSEMVVAKVVVVNRDSFLDYVILNCITKSVDEFSFNSSNALEKFSDKIYYSGLTSYYKKVDNRYISFNKSYSISKKEFCENSKFIKNKWKQIYNDSNPTMPSSKDGWNGFYSWNTLINSPQLSSYTNNEWRYLNGINPNGVSSGLNFRSQKYFNDYFSCSNSCGPTACTNMFKWFNYQGIRNKNGVVNALKNGSEYDTFARFRQLLKHDVNGTTERSEYNDALKNYAKEQGYSYEIDRYIDTYEEFKENIDKGMPVLTSVGLDSWGGHGLLVVGYESFAMPYTVSHSFLWSTWTTTEYKYARYLRVIDGWSSSNNSVFIDASGYWDFLEGRGFKIYG